MLDIDTVLRPSAARFAEYGETLKLSTIGDTTGALRVLALTELLAALGFAAMAREVKATDDLPRLRRYAAVIVKASARESAEWREQTERLLGRLGLR